MQSIVIVFLGVVGFDLGVIQVEDAVDLPDEVPAFCNVIAFAGNRIGFCSYHQLSFLHVKLDYFEVNVSLEVNEFLFNSAAGGLDYLTAFAKSIPADEWKDYKVNKNNFNKPTLFSKFY